MKIQQIQESRKVTQNLIDQLWEQDDDSLILSEDDQIGDGPSTKDKEKAQKALENNELERELNAFKRGLEELSMLADAMETAEFGVLIGKRDDRITKQDIPLIKSRIREILEDNEVIGGADVLQSSATDTFKVIANRMHHQAEKWITLIVGGTLSWASIGFFASAGLAAMPVAMILSGSALIALGIRQSRINKSIKTAAKVMSLTKAWSEMGKSGNADIDDRGIFRKMFDKLMMKSPKRIKQDAVKDSEENAREAAKRFQNIARDMPKSINYIDDDGEVNQYPVARLFTRS